MAGNTLPTNAFERITLGGKMHLGIVSLASTLKLTLVTAEGFETDLQAFITQNDLYNAQRTTRQAASDAFQAEAAKCYSWLLAASNSFATAWGTRWNAQWLQAGFINNSTAIPQKLELRLGLMLAIVSLFKTNPSLEVPTQNLTAVFGAALHKTTVDAGKLVTDETVKLNDISTAWTTASDALTADMKDLLRNLSSVLADDDARWLSFGLQMPSTISTPGQVVNVTAHSDGQGNIIVQWDAMALATRYRVRSRIVGVQTDYTLAASSTSTMAAIGNVQPGQTVQIIVQAVNGNLQGLASDPITFAVLLPETKAAEPRAVTPAAVSSIEEEIVLAARNGNGSSNGNGHRTTAPSRAH